jgi:hypothetical protein
MAKPATKTAGMHSAARMSNLFARGSYIVVLFSQAQTRAMPSSIGTRGR